MAKKEVIVERGIEDILLAITTEPINHDRRYELATTLCELIAKGKPHYNFSPDKNFDAVPLYWAERGNLMVDKLTMSELELNMLIETGNFEKWAIITPTPKAIAIYGKLKERGRIDKNGYLDGIDSGI